MRQLGSVKNGPVRLTDFWERMQTQFGRAYAGSVANDQSIAALGGRTPAQALEAGEDVRAVWLAVCEHFEVPVAERH
jgi:hypothetical protein